MEAFKITINDQLPHHARFLKEQREDPFTHKKFEHGDETIVTSSKEVWLYNSWVAWSDGDSTGFLKDLPNASAQFKPRILTFEAIPREVSKGQTFTLRWDATSSEKVEIEGVGTFQETQGSIKLTADTTQRYHLHAINTKGKAKESLIVKVLVPLIRTSISKIDFGRFFANQLPKSKEIVISNKGNGILKWQVIDSPDWLTIDEDNDNRLRFAVNPIKDGILSSQVSILSNGGDLTIPVKAHIIPALIKSFSVVREGYLARVNWKLHTSVAARLNKKPVSSQGVIYLPYLHKKKIKLSVKDCKGNKDKRSYRIRVPIPKLSAPVRLVYILALRNVRTLRKLRIRLASIINLKKIGIALQQVQTKLRLLILLNQTQTTLIVPEPLISKIIPLKSGKEELLNHVDINTVTIKIR